MAHIDPEHTLLISKWTQEIIAGLIFVLILIMKFIGKFMGGEKIQYATKKELQECSKTVSDKIDKLDSKIDNYVTHLHDRIDRQVDR